MRSSLSLSLVCLAACGGGPKPYPAPIPRVDVKPRTAYALQVIDLMPGSGAAAEAQKCHYVHYTGWLTDGKKFDSSRDADDKGQPREPISFPQGFRRVIPGWDTGFEGMQVGGKRRLIIPYQLAYGEKGRPPVIPPKATLVFDVELMAVADTLSGGSSVEPVRPSGPAVPRCAPWASTTARATQEPAANYPKAPPLPDLRGKVALITGSTDGLGRDVARRLAQAGAHVLITGRSAARGDSLVDEITKSGKGSAKFYRADLASLAETRRLGDAVARDNKRLDFLINNAGVGFVFDSTRKMSADSFEMHFAVNYLAHYLLTKQLLPLIAASAPARIINVSSGSQAPIDFDDVMMEKGFTGGRGYAQSKLAQIMMTIDMAPALERQGILTYSLHPATTMATTMARALNVTPRSTIAEGVESVVNAIVTTEPTGTYFNRLAPVKAQAQAYDAAARERLRTLSERLIGK